MMGYEARLKAPGQLNESKFGRWGQPEPLSMMLIWNAEWGSRVCDPPKVRGKALRKKAKRVIQFLYRDGRPRPKP